MTAERLTMETKILEQFYPGAYTIELLEDDDCIINYDRGDGKSFSIIDMKEYPEKPPQIVVIFFITPNSVFDPVSGEFVIHNDIKETDGKYYLTVIPENEFNPQWSIFKIIRLVNEWIENNCKQSNNAQSTTS